MLIPTFGRHSLLLEKAVGKIFKMGNQITLVAKNQIELLTYN